MMVVVMLYTEGGMATQNEMTGGGWVNRIDFPKWWRVVRGGGNTVPLIT